MPPQIPTFAAMCRLKFRPCEAFVLTSALRNGREQIIIIFITLYSVSACRKNLFLKQTSNLLSLSPCPLSPGKGDFTGATAPSPCRGLRPKARMLWLLAKSFARCKTSRASNTRHPIFYQRKRFFDSL